MATHTDLIGSAEVCRILDVHQSTVGRWVESGKLRPAHKLPGRNGAYLFRRADVEALLSSEASA